MQTEWYTLPSHPYDFIYTQNYIVTLKAIKLYLTYKYLISEMFDYRRSTSAEQLQPVSVPIYLLTADTPPGLHVHGTKSFPDSGVYPCQYAYQ